MLPRASSVVDRASYRSGKATPRSVSNAALGTVIRSPACRPDLVTPDSGSEQEAVVGAATEVVPTVDGEALTGDPSGLGAGEEPHGCGDVLDGPEATDRHLARDSRRAVVHRR